VQSVGNKEEQACICIINQEAWKTVSSSITPDLDRLTGLASAKALQNNGTSFFGEVIMLYRIPFSSKATKGILFEFICLSRSPDISNARAKYLIHMFQQCQPKKKYTVLRMPHMSPKSKEQN
jgi:hypothetical protein